MAAAVSAQPRVTVDGKFFRLGDAKFFIKGVAYGPFAPNAAGEPFASPEQTALDLTRIDELGANVVRVYHVPPRWFLDMAAERRLKVLVDIPWNKHLCFDSAQRRQEARDAVRRAVYTTARHPAIFAYSVGNEIPPDIVRWIGGAAVSDFIDELVLEAKQADPQCLCTYTNFPPTEFLDPRCTDFVCFNVYLHHEAAFRNYLARLQLAADARPLVLGEFGIDSIREGETRKCEILSWQIEQSFRGGLAGTVIFAFTDEWYRDGRMVEGWEMGLTTADRRPRESFHAVQTQFGQAPYFPLPRYPRVSVVVAAYNTERTLGTCLGSLRRLNYPDYEVILVDDGSTDGTNRIASNYPEVRYHRHSSNLGLSAARNTGIAAATGEIIAFTDADCRADEDWLYYLVGTLLESRFAGAGGPNLLPPDDSAIGAVVMASPGGPAHVMLNDREAEHVPGCNMAFFRWALEEIGGFDPIYTKAGDDVDVCWRLQQAGHRIGFSPAAFVWHYRRSTIAAYLKQQKGYGEAEALLVRKHPEHFNFFGGGIWRGRIYGPAKIGVEVQGPVIYRGLFGSAGFQKLYATGPATTLMLSTTLEYHLFVTLPVWILSAVFPRLLPVAAAVLLLPVALCGLAAFQASLPRNKAHWWSRPLVGLLFFLQPIVRGWARYRGRLAVHPPALAARQSLDSIALRNSGQSLREVQYWAQNRLDRLEFVKAILGRLDERHWPHRPDSGWNDYDVEIYGSRWSNLQLTTLAEDHPGNRQMIRCRLRPVSSLVARMALWSVAGFQLLLIGWMTSWQPWSWLLLLTLPVCFWLLLRDQRNLQSVAVVLLDELAKEHGLTKVNGNA
ncbi:MAG TPA: glycosyltransferase [Verrucomicrobia bacterium]|nr:glycosyltransferase [Verrucomicrobiota bacterium]HOP97468.1 glycosyltransferase [Verrucomicrobiota bacterium]HPU55995.1 glycosyltransferase [Verrucomicrobiota bacterium]